MTTAWMRFAYACQFLLAVVATFTLWSQVGGQGHLDLMPWYAKLLLGTGASAAAVGLSISLGREEKILNRRTIIWVVAVILLAAGMGAMTYYVHLHEVVDEPDEEGTTASAALTVES